MQGPEDRQPPIDELSPDARYLWTGQGWVKRPTRRRTVLRWISVTAGAIVLLCLAFGLITTVPLIIYFTGHYPGAPSTVARPCRLLSPGLASSLIPGARPSQIGLGCGWYAPGASYRQGDGAVLGFEPYPQGPMLLSTPDQAAQQFYRSGVAFRGWRAVPDLGDEAAELGSSELEVRTGNVVWTLDAEPQVSQRNLLAAARAIAHSLSRQTG
jgi:hypothetical protein